MNIFVLSLDPREAATFHSDRHVGKMFLEACQLLCGAHPLPFETGSMAYKGWLLSSPQERAAANVLPYVPTHRNHPCQKWVQESLANYDWLLQLAAALGNECEYRFGKRYATDLAWLWCARHYPDSTVKPDVSWAGRLKEWYETHRTPFAQAMPETYRNPDAVTAYRNYYAAEKRTLGGKPATWTRRAVPEWMQIST